MFHLSNNQLKKMYKIFNQRIMFPPIIKLLLCSSIRI